MLGGKEMLAVTPKEQEEEVIATTPAASISRPGDKEIWEDIFYYKLGGVVFHLKAMAIFDKHELKGYARMHEYHAKQEFAAAVHILGDAVTHLGSNLLIDFTRAHAVPTLVVQGSTMEEKMIHGLEVYEEWEDNVYKKLKEYKHKLTDTKEHIDYLIHDVREEREFIHELWEMIEDKKVNLEELDKKICHYYTKKMD